MSLDTDKFQGVEGRIYTAEDVMKIVELSMDYRGIMTGYMPLIHRREPIRDEVLKVLDDYLSNLTNYREFFEIQIGELENLITELKKYKRRRNEVIK